jgi:hypothetical protein
MDSEKVILIEVTRLREIGCRGDAAVLTDDELGCAKPVGFASRPYLQELVSLM